MVFGKQSLQGYESNRWNADGVRVEKIPRNHGVGPPREDSKKKSQIYSVNRSTSKARSSSRRCLTTLYGMQKETQNNVNTIHRQLRNMLANFLAVIGLSWGLDQKRSSDISCLQCLGETETGELRSKEGRKKSIHFNGSNETIELLLRTVISARLKKCCKKLVNKSMEDIHPHSRVGHNDY